MGLKAGWIALFVFVWVIGAFLGSTFDYQASADSVGQTYSTGTATFTNGSTTVNGVGTNWVAAMEDGIIKSDTDDVWYKIKTIDAVNQLTLYVQYAEAGGVGHNYTMQPTPGWAGSGGGGYSTSPLAKMEGLMNVTQSTQRNPVAGAISILTSSTFWGSAFEIVTWQWSFLEGYEMIYWIFLFPFAVMGLLSMLLLVYGVLTGNLTWS